MRVSPGNAWTRLGLVAKFGVLYAAVLLLIVVAFLVCYASLRMLQHAEDAILTSMEIRQGVYALDGQMEMARRLYRDFLLNYPQIGYAEATNRYAMPAIVSMARLTAINERLRSLLDQPNISANLRRRNVDIHLYLSTVKRFTSIALDQYDLFHRLANPETGLEPQMDGTIAALRAIASTNNTLSLALQEVFLLEKEYRLTRNRPVMQASLNMVGRLRTELAMVIAIDPARRHELQILLDRYESLSGRIMELDVAIRGNANEFVLQAQAMDPIDADLKDISSAEVEAARQRIAWASRLAGGIILATAVLCLVATLCLARFMHASVTARLVALTRRVARLRAVEPDDGTAAVPGDELVVLDDTFTAMATRVEDLVANLEAKVLQRTRQLDTINRELDRKNQTLEVLSQTDRLTGLCNRRKLDHTLEAEIRRVRRYNTPFTVAMLDLDHFKDVNDRFGHQRGDAVLLRVADLLLVHLRDTDIVGRWGGEEFLIVCPETPLRVAGRLAKRLCREIAQTVHPDVGRVTASFGLAQYRSGTDAAQLIAAADAALYQAKQTGRNRVVLASADFPS